MDRALITVAILVLLVLSTGRLAYGSEDSVAKMTLGKWFDIFEIERPWDVLPNMTDGSRRHRGALAHVYHRLNSGEISAEALESFYYDLGRLLALENAKQVFESKPAFSDYQAFFRIDVFQLWKQLITEKSVPIRWQSNFKEAYFSQADGAGVIFDVHMPPSIQDQKTYPMIVALKGGPKVNPGIGFPFIQVKPSRGNIWGFRAISGYDVMQVVAFMKRHYPVDPNRVYLVGFSAGASGAMHVASSYPDAFAAVLPMVAVGTDFPVVNFKNLPVAMHHGTVDWTSSICNARVQYEKMKALSCPVTLVEYPEIGHTVPKPHEPIVSWMFKQSRNQSPVSITHECETPALGRSYWFHIREFQDPHQRAFVEASVDFSSGRGTVRVHSRNVQAFTLYLDLMPRGEGRIETVEIGGDRLATMGSAKRLDCRLQGGRWQVVSDMDSVDQSKRPYHAGAAANLYQGEPLLVVYGTGSDDTERVDQLRLAAQKLASCGGPVFYAMKDRFSVVADSELNAEQEANCNLVLVGRPEENRVAQKIFPGLPITIQNDILVAADRPHLKLRDQVLSLLHPHPDHPKRLVYLIAPFMDEGAFARFCEAPQQFLVGSEGFDRVSQADLVVQNLDHQIGRQMQFGKDWDWVNSPGSDRKLPTQFSDRTNLAMTYLEIMRRKSGADFALWWGPEDRGMWGYDFNYLKRYNPEFYTQADFRTQHRLAETMIGRVSGFEMKEILDVWIRNGQLVSVPEVQVDNLVDRKEYQVHIPMDLYIKLGQRKKNLIDPKPGPTVSSEDVMAEIFH